MAVEFETSGTFDQDVGGFSITDAISMQGWKEIPIHEISDPLVSLNDLQERARIVVCPGYFLQGIEAADYEVGLRKGAADRLVLASNLLPEGYRFVVLDGHRPLSVQEELFSSLLSNLRESDPTLTNRELIDKTQIYVSLPSSDPTKPSPHSTGGAIDLSIIDGDNQLLEMGTAWDTFGIESRTDYFRDTDYDIHRNRELLHKVMTAVGFTNYPEEWWHYDYGNQFWGHIKTRPAIYGITKGGENMDIEKGQTACPTVASDLVEGPFAVRLRTGGNGQPERIGRLIVGGPVNSREHLKTAMEQIESLPDGLSFEELQKVASGILNQNGLVRVDF